MAGHSKFKNIMHRKGAQDKKRAGRFNKMAREITVAAKMGGPEADMNPRLRLAIAKAKEVNMPNDRIKRAIEQGTPGSDDGKIYEEVRYEGYALGGVAVIVETLTDNRTRTVSDVRMGFTKNGGTMGDSGSVAFMFEQVGEIVYPKDKATDDEAFEAAVEAGAENVESDEEYHSVFTAIGDFGAVREALETKWGAPERSGLIWKPATMNPVADVETAEKIMKMVDVLEENDDVQNVFTNMDLTDEVAEKLSSE